MSTNGQYEITQNGTTRNFYIHWDNYPSGARERLSMGLENGVFSTDLFKEKNKAEENTDCGYNYKYTVNTDKNTMVITSDYYKDIGDGGYNSRYVSFEVQHSMTLETFMKTFELDDSDNTFNFEDENYTFAFNQAVKKLEAEEAIEEERKALERTAANNERLKRAKDMGAKEIKVEVKSWGVTDEVITGYIAKGKYIRIETSEETVVLFVGEEVATGNGSYKYPSYGAIKSITEKTVSTIGGGDYDGNCRLKMQGFLNSNKNKVRMVK